MEEFLLNLISNHPGAIYWTVFAVLFACGLGFPMPEDITLLTGGYAVYVAEQRGLPSPALVPMILVGFAGVMVGDILLFLLGRYLGRRVTHVWPFRLMVTKRRLERVQKFFGRYGMWAAFMARFAAGLRAPTFLLAGAAKMKFVVFFLADGIAALISVPLLVFLAWHFGAEIDQVKVWIVRSKYALAVIFSCLAIWIIAKLVIGAMRRRSEKSATIAIPSDADSNV